tara:strand:+ start:29 stop:1237 length:1209 start_codon:yes stop_codon:yes gene_type:complete
MKKKTMGIIVSIDDYASFVRQNKDILEELSNKFKEIYVVNVLRLKFGKNKSFIKNENDLPKNFICKTIEKSSEFLNFFKDKDFIAIQYLDKTPASFKIYYLIKRSKIKNIMIMNIGNFGNKQTIDLNIQYFFSAYKHYYMKGFYYFFRILTILNIFPKVDLLFESKIDTIHALNNGISRKFERLFPFFKISYFRKIEKVNSIFYDHFISESKKLNLESKNQILYIDTPLNHPDRVLREGNISETSIKNFYNNLNIFLKKLSKIFNMKVFICLHPSNTIDLSYFKDFEISKKSTIDMIPISEIIIFSLSSAILNAVMYKKKILNINSKHMGDYLSNFNKKYVNSLNLLSLNIDDEFKINKEECLKKLNDSIKDYDLFIKKRLNPDGDKLSKEKIVEKIKENFF